MKIRPIGAQATSAGRATSTRKSQHANAEGRICPLQVARIPDQDGDIGLRPARLAKINDEELVALVELLAQMLSADPVARAIPLRRAA